MKKIFDKIDVYNFSILEVGAIASSLILFVILLFTTEYQLSPSHNFDINTNTPVNITTNALPVSPLFIDATLQSGIDFVHFQGDKTITGLNEIIGSGVCVIDYNNDGWQDLFIVGGSGQTRYFGKTHWWQRSTSSKLYKNKGNGTFEDVTSRAGLKKQYWGMGCTTGDLDNDGNAELLVTTFSNNYLYQNNGDGTFSDISESAGIKGNSWSTSVSLTDYNKDGLLDIYIVNYLAFDKTLRTLESQSGFNTNQSQFLVATNFDSSTNVLYQNTGNLTFTDVTKTAKIGNASGRGLSAVWVDLNNDQYQDLIISNDANSPNTIYVNQQDGTFVNASNEFKFSDLSASNSVAIADMDNNGINDIAISGGIGKLPKLYLANENNIKINKYNGENEFNYTDQVYSFFEKPHSLNPLENWTLGLKDFNNDGFTDIFFANGLKTPDLDTSRITVGQQNKLLLNHGGRRLIETSYSNPFSNTRLSSRGAVFADFDNDGDIDIFVTNNNDMARFYRNDSPRDSHWVGLKLIASNGPRDAIGAKVWLKSDNLTQFKEITSGSGFLSNSSTLLHFGLGTDNKINELRIQWPNGKFQRIDLPGKNKIYIIEEGTTTLKNLPLPIEILQEPLLLNIGEEDPVNRSLYLEILWNENKALFFSEVKKTINDPNPQVRRTAIELLASTKSKQALKLLLQYLNENDPQNLITAIKWVATYEDEQSIQWLLQLFSHSNEKIRLAVVEQFIYFFNKEEAVVHRKFLAVPYLIKLLSDRSLDVQLAAIKALGVSESYRGVFPLLKLLKNNNPDIQIAAANSLGHIREQKATYPLLELVNDITAPENVRAQALIALKRIGYDADSLTLSLLEESPINLGVIYYILTDNIDGLVLNRKRLSKSLETWLLKNISLFNDKTGKSDTRSYFFLINLIAYLNSKDLNHYLVNFSKNQNPTIRLFTYLSQLEYNNNPNKEALLNALKTESFYIRNEILLALKDFKIAINIPMNTVKSLLKNKKSAIHLIQYYGKVVSKNTGKNLIDIASDENRDLDVRIAALNSLISKPYLNNSTPVKLLQHKNQSIRHLSIQHWSISQSKKNKWLKEKPNFMLNLEKMRDYEAIIETSRNRQEPWGNKAITNIILNSEATLNIRKKAVEALVNSTSLNKTSAYSTIVNSNDDSILQLFLKQVNLEGETKYIPTLKKIVTNENLSATTRLLAAKQIGNNKTNLLKLMTKQNNESQ